MKQSTHRPSNKKLLKPGNEYKNAKLGDRTPSMLFLLLYGMLFYFVYRDYVSIEWGYTGLYFRPFNSGEILALTILIAIQGWNMPQFINSPSSIMLWMLTVTVHVPTLIITPMIGERDPSSYYPELFAMSAIMLIASLLDGNSNNKDNATELPEERFFHFFLFVFIIFTAVLYNQYREIMTFSSIEDVYFQRFAASDLAASSLMGYVRTYYLYVLSPFLFSCGFIKSKYWQLSVIGFSGFIVSYYIDASKISFVIPLIIIAFATLLKFTSKRTWLLNAGMAVLTGLSGLLAIFFPGLKLFADLVLFRSIAIPAQTFAQYADVFDARGYTWWSHVRGISSIVAPPENLSHDPDWPSLGLIVGADFHTAESRTNLNANLFVGEGIAAAGPLGVIVIGLALIAYLRLLNAAAKRWDQNFVIFASAPLALGLTNTHLSTLLLSFGGIFWLALFHFLRPTTERITAR